MKNKIFALILTAFAVLNATVFAQTPSASHSSVQVTLLANDASATKTTKAAKPAKTAKTVTAAKPAKAPKAPRKNKVEAVSTAVATSETICPERQLATFVFVVNRGEVFAVNAPGELTELGLSGFTTDALPIANGGMMNENTCRNTVKLTGAVTINDYSPEPATHVIASLHLLPLTASRGLSLSLTIDGAPLRVLLPFDSGDCRWRGGYTYRYVLTLNGGALQVTGMTVNRTTPEKR